MSEWRTKLFTGMAICALLGSCGSGSSSSGAVTALSLPDQVSLVDAQGDGGLGAVLGAREILAKSKGLFGASTTQYDSDETQLWVHDDSMEALNTINMILSSIEQTRYEHASILNEGPYIALVANEERGSSQGGSGRGGDSADYERFVVQSSRADAGAAQIVEFWIEQKGDGGSPQILYGKLTITQSPSTSLPYGAFTMTFKQLLATQSHDDAGVSMQGTLKTVARSDGQAEFAFLIANGDVGASLGVGDSAFRLRARLVADADGTTGRAYSETTYAQNQGGGTVVQNTSYYLQYNAAYMARKKVTTGDSIAVFDRTDFNTKIFRYGLYNAATGARVENNSGFGVETQSGDFGWAGYHGLWFPDHITITDGQTLIRRSYISSSANQNYTAVVVPGRLEKRTRSTITLANVIDEDLESFDNSTGTMILVQWTGSDLKKVATRSGTSWTRLGSPTSVAGSYSTNDYLSLYSKHRGSVQFVWPSGGPTDSTEAYVWETSTITSASSEVSGSNLTLYGYHDMLKAGITQNQANFSGDTPYYTPAANVGQGKTYVFNATTMMLELSSVNVDLASGVTISTGPGVNGLSATPLFSSALGALTQMGNQTTQYSWSIGSNTWNQLRMIKDTNGDFVSFSAPLRLDYTHSEVSNTQYHGKTFVLEWQGTDLHGIPFTESSSDNRWYPGFNIPSGTLITKDGVTYKVKQLEGEQTMVAVGNPSAVIASEGFDLNIELTAPADEYTDPAIGAMPTLTEAPTFVGGTKQND